jgi:valyl-tRNA synthetase
MSSCTLLLCKGTAAAAVQGQDGYYVARSYEDARAQATAAGVSTDTPLNQDEDVLDTWFRLVVLLFRKVPL